MAQSTLTTLPYELLAEICGHLCWHCLGGHGNGTRQFYFERGAADTRGEPEPLLWTRGEQAALLNLVRTCRGLRAAAEPFLYHYFYTASISEFYPFVRTILERPDLGLQLSEVDLVHIGGVPEDDSEPLAQRVTESIEHHKELERRRREELVSRNPGFNGLGPGSIPWLNRYPLFPGDNVEKILAREEYAELVSLLLPLTPNLQRAHLRLPCSSFPSLERPLHPDFPLLNSLKFLTINRTGPAFFINKAAPILRLAPNLEVLHCYDCAHANPNLRADLERNAPASNPVPLSSLTSLHLTSAGNLTNRAAPPDSLTNLVAAAGPTLSRVTIRRADPTRFFAYGIHTRSSSYDTLEFHYAVRALQPRASTLRHFSFHFLHPNPDPLSPSPYFMGVLELRTLTALEVLETQTLFVDYTGHQRASGEDGGLTVMLPTSLKRLRLRGYQRRMGCLLAGLVDGVQAGEYPGLRWVGVDEQVVEGEKEEWERETLAKMREIGEGFRAAGVEFVVFPGKWPKKPDEYEDEEGDGEEESETV